MEQEKVMDLHQRSSISSAPLASGSRRLHTRPTSNRAGERCERQRLWCRGGPAVEQEIRGPKGALH